MSAYYYMSVIIVTEVSAMVQMCPQMEPLWVQFLLHFFEKGHPYLSGKTSLSNRFSISKSISPDLDPSFNIYHATDAIVSHGTPVCTQRTCMPLTDSRLFLYFAFTPSTPHRGIRMITPLLILIDPIIFTSINKTILFIKYIWNHRPLAVQ